MKEEEGVKLEGKNDEKEQRRLRDGHKKEEITEKIDAGDIVYLAVTGEKAGECTLAATYSESWDFQADGEQQDPDAKFYTYQLIVSEAAKPVTDIKTEEKAE